MNTGATDVSETMNPNSLQDAEAPLPYIRRKQNFKPDEAKFTYEAEKVSVRITERTEEGKKISTKETVTEDKEHKVYLKQYGKSSEEDCEHFFEAFEHMQTKLPAIWTEVQKAKDRDATILFEAMDTMLVGTALTEWHDVLQQERSRTWEMFKTKVAEFITTKVLPEDSYNKQITYMRERRKPMALTSNEWWLRIQTLDRYLPYFIGTLAKLKNEFPSATFTEWWKSGSLTQAEYKRVVTTRVPSEWQEKLAVVDVGHTFRDNRSINDLIDYFTTLESLEQRRRQPARRIGGPRSGQRISNRGRQQNNYYQQRNDYYNNRPVSQQQQRSNNYYGRSARPGGQQQQQQGTAVPRRQQYAPTMQQQYRYQPFQGGRGRGPATRGGNQRQFGGQRTGYGQPQQYQGGHPRSEVHFQDDDPGVNTGEEADVEDNNEQTGGEDQYANLTQEELIAEWNENLFIDSPDNDEWYDSRNNYDYGDDDAYFYEEGGDPF